MVSELLQDRPRLVKQMGTIIFILVCKWIFKFPLGYLKYHQRSTIPTKEYTQYPSSQNQIPWKLLPKEGTELLMAFCWCCGELRQNLRSSGRMARGCTPLEALLGWPKAAHPWKPLCKPCPAEDSCGVCCAVAAPQSSVQCWKSCSSSSEMGATGLLWVHLLISLPLAEFVPAINPQSSWTPQLSSCWVDRNSSITEGVREMGHFRKDMLLETCPCNGNAWERPETQSDFSDFSPFCSLHYFVCKSFTYRHIGQMHFPLLWV